MKFLLLFVVVLVIASFTCGTEDEKVKDPAVICKLPAERGPCRAFEKKWAYNAEEGKCEEFTYGGCRGNANNFKTEAECQEFCGKAE